MSEVVLRPGKKSKPLIPPEPAKAQLGARKDLDILLRKALKNDSHSRPGFAEAWVGDSPVDDAARITRYYVGTAKVDICTAPDGEILYRMTPREYTLPDAGMKLLYRAKAEFVESSKEGRNLLDSRAMKNRCRKEANEIISILARSSGITPGQVEQMGGLDFLTDALLRHTIGLGLVEYLLEDEHVQDIYIDAPADDNPVHVVVGDIGDKVHGKCITNIVLSEKEVQALVSRFRYESGRPFSEAMPVLETDLLEFGTRVTVVGKPLSPDGVAIALRRHSVEPWTLPRLIDRKSLNPLAAGLLSFLIDGRSTILVAGSRGAGKSSMLGAMMLEFPLSQRILTIEDTIELPGAKMQELGYKVQSLFVQSAIGGSGDRTTDDALRVSLRLGESAIVLGEVRGKEAKTLYEAMRSGSAGSAVMGTIHGNSPKSVFERIVYDLDIHPEAFSATDIVVVCGLVRPGGRQKQARRITSISELVKDGEPGQFADLLVYDDQSDALVETEYFLSSSARINMIAEQWGLDYNTAIANIRARARMREMMTIAGKQHPGLLGPNAVVKANGQYWNLVDVIGSGEPGKLMNEWSQWFERSAPYV
ncbi:MAG: type II/IV secretion system ATPase subunit [Thermoplasmata archaeon]|nr:type II/IV secretion system ATPase subunit [Thermoplasmata archaeon]